MLTYRTIVVGVDFSATSHDAIRIATAIARDMPACQVHLLHVAEEPVCDAWTVAAPPVDATGVRWPWLEHARQRLEAVAGTLAINPARLTCAVVVGSPHRDIARYALEHRADLIVVGSHGYGPVKHLLLGSVAEDVVRQATCRVLVVPHEGLRQPTDANRSAVVAS
jgi:nucleotide-binding universal stress UspA family protein